MKKIDQIEHVSVICIVIALSLSVLFLLTSIALCVLKECGVF